MGDANPGPVRLSFEPRLRVESRRAAVTPDAGPWQPRDPDERLGPGAPIAIVPDMREPRR